MDLIEKSIQYLQEAAAAINSKSESEGIVKTTVTQAVTNNQHLTSGNISNDTTYLANTIRGRYSMASPQCVQNPVPPLHELRRSFPGQQQNPTQTVTNIRQVTNRLNRGSLESNDTKAFDHNYSVTTQQLVQNTGTPLQEFRRSFPIQQRNSAQADSNNQQLANSFNTSSTPELRNRFQDNCVTPQQYTVTPLQEFRKSFPGLHGLRSKDRGRGRSYGSLRKKPYAPSFTWTQRFYCLADPNDESTADRKYNDVLEANNLGFRKITFDNKEGDHSYFISKLVANYPSLASQEGAVAIWKCGTGGSQRRPLLRIHPGPDGYTIPYLKSRTQSGMLYITPLQSRLLPEGIGDPLILDQYEEPNKSESVAVTAQCRICKSSVALYNFAEHLHACSSQMLAGEESQGDHIPDNNEAIATLKQIFPEVQDEELQTAHNLSSSIDEAVEKILDKKDEDEIKEEDEVQIITQKPSSSKLSAIDITSLLDLQSYLFNNLDTDALTITVDRAEIWRETLLFYKKALLDKTRLFRELTIHFSVKSGEEKSVDAGAIKRKFFNLVMEIISARLFEGEHTVGMLPKKLGSSGKEVNYKIAGMVVGHAFSQCGIIFGRLPNCLFHYFVNPDDIDLLKCLASEKFVPLNAATEVFHQLISALRGAESESDLQSILESDRCFKRINGSQWAIDENITMSNKENLILELIYDEIYRKRSEQLKQFREGLELVGILKWVKKYPNITKDIFLYSQLTTPLEYLTEQINRCIVEGSKENENEINVLLWLKQYLELSPEKAKEVLKFSTSYETIPPWGLNKLKIKLLEDDENKVFPEASACFKKLYLPVVHTVRSTFFKYFDIALKFECEGFSIEE